MFKKRISIIIILFLLSLFTRTFWLDRFPTGITNDELHFVLNAKAVFYGFTDMSGQWNPLSLTTIPDNQSAELTSPFLAPFLGPISLNLFNTRLVFAFISSFFVIVIYLIGFEINPLIGLISGLLTIINPWFFYMGRTAFDMPIAMFFLTLSFYLLLKLKNNWLYLSLISILLGFYTYIGTKVIFIPYIFLVIYFCWQKNKHKNITQYITITFICLIATLHYVYIIFNGPSRLGELITPFNQQITNSVEIERNQSSPSILNRFFINRYTLYSYFFTQKYLNSFSPDLMFLKGDETYLLSFWKHGYFYYLDLLFLGIGAYYLFRHHKSYFFVFVTAILLSPIPEAIRKDTIPAYSFHSCLQYPFLIIIISAGIYKSINRFHKLIFPIVLIYLILFLDLFNLYFFRYPVYQPEGFSFSNRLISKYIIYERNLNKDITVVTNEPSNLFRQYLFYSKKYSQENFESIKDIYQNNRKDISFDHIRFTSEKVESISQTNMVYITQTNLHQLYQPHLSIRHFISGLEMYSIYNSTLCPPKQHPKIPQISIDDFDIDRLSIKDYCFKFISSN